MNLLEAGDGVDVTAFLNITGQVIYSKIMEAYTQEAFVVSKLVDTIPTRLDGEKIPGIARLSATRSTEVAPGMPYPQPRLRRRLHRNSVDHEARLHRAGDQGGDLLRPHVPGVVSGRPKSARCSGLNKEKRLLDLLIGATNNYKWRGTTYNTYQTAAPWVNVKTSNELVDWTNVDAAEQLFADILDPNTGEPVLVEANTVLVMPAYRHAAHRVFNAAGDSSTSPPTSRPPRWPPIRWATTRWSKAGWLTAASWPRARRPTTPRSGGSSAISSKAFAYMENWPITVTQSPQNSEADFNQDIVVRFKASERGAAAVINPRYVVKNTG